MRSYPAYSCACLYHMACFSTPFCTLQGALLCTVAYRYINSNNDNPLVSLCASAALTPGVLGIWESDPTFQHRHHKVFYSDTHIKAAERSKVNRGKGGMNQ